jgi:hypothetical protein
MKNWFFLKVVVEDMGREKTEAFNFFTLTV